MVVGNITQMTADDNHMNALPNSRMFWDFLSKLYPTIIPETAAYDPGKCERKQEESRRRSEKNYIFPKCIRKC